MSAWMWKGNESEYPIEKYLREYPYVYWATPVLHDDIQPGDDAWIWKQKKGAKGAYGIIARGKVVERCTHRTKVRFPEYLRVDLWRTKPKPALEWTTGINIEASRFTPAEGMLDSDFLKRHVPKLYPLRMPGGKTVCSVSEHDAGVLRELWEATSPLGPTLEEDEYFEGGTGYRWHRYIERDRKLVVDAKARFCERNGGKLFCEACKFCFQDHYVGLGPYIEAHHIKPVSEMKSDEKVRVEDLMMLCANCHRMAHRPPKTSTRSELINKLRAASLAGHSAARAPTGAG